MEACDLPFGNADALRRLSVAMTAFDEVNDSEPYVHSNADGAQVMAELMREVWAVLEAFNVR